MKLSEKLLMCANVSQVQQSEQQQIWQNIDTDGPIIM